MGDGEWVERLNREGNRTYYSSLDMGVDRFYSVGDVVEVLAGRNSYYVAKIVSFFQERGDDEKLCTLGWYYRQKDIVRPEHKLPKHARSLLKDREVFWCTLEDDNNVETLEKVVGMCSSLSEYMAKSTKDDDGVFYLCRYEYSETKQHGAFSLRDNKCQDVETLTVLKVLNREISADEGKRILRDLKSSATEEGKGSSRKRMMSPKRKRRGTDTSEEDAFLRSRRKNRRIEYFESSDEDSDLERPVREDSQPIVKKKSSRVGDEYQVDSLPQCNAGGAGKVEDSCANVVWKGGMMDDEELDRFLDEMKGMGYGVHNGYSLEGYLSTLASNNYDSRATVEYFKKNPPKRLQMYSWGKEEYGKLLVALEMYGKNYMLIRRMLPGMSVGDINDFIQSHRQEPDLRKALAETSDDMWKDFCSSCNKRGTLICCNTCVNVLCYACFLERGMDWDAAVRAPLWLCERCNINTRSTANLRCYSCDAAGANRINCKNPKCTRNMCEDCIGSSSDRDTWLCGPCMRSMQDRLHAATPDDIAAELQKPRPKEFLLNIKESMRASTRVKTRESLTPSKNKGKGKLKEGTKRFSVDTPTKVTNPVGIFANKELIVDCAPNVGDDLCAVCFYGEPKGRPEGPDELVYCDGCDLCVHLSCYFLDEVPPGKWYCKTCEANLVAEKPSCVLCPWKGGMYLKTNRRREWVHVSCALWMPGVVIDDQSLVVNYEAVDPKRYRLACKLCSQKGTHPSIQDASKRCMYSFHIMCGIQAGFNFPYDMESPIYCLIHANEQWKSPFEAKWREQNAHLGQNVLRRRVSQMVGEPDAMSDEPSVGPRRSRWSVRSRLGTGDEDEDEDEDEIEDEDENENEIEDEDEEIVDEGGEASRDNNRDSSDVDLNQDDDDSNKKDDSHAANGRRHSEDVDMAGEGKKNSEKAVDLNHQIVPNASKHPKESEARATDLPSSPIARATSLAAMIVTNPGSEGGCPQGCLPGFCICSD